MADESILRDILTELDKERKKRAELEAKLYDLTKKKEPEDVEGDGQKKQGKIESSATCPPQTKKISNVMEFEDTIASSLILYKTKISLRLTHKQNINRILKPIVQDLFSDIYDRRSVGNIDGKKAKAEMIEEAVSEVISEYEKKVSIRFTHSENVDKQLYPIIKRVSYKFLPFARSETARLDANVGECIDKIEATLAEYIYFKENDASQRLEEEENIKQVLEPLLAGLFAYIYNKYSKVVNSNEESNVKKADRVGEIVGAVISEYQSAIKSSHLSLKEGVEDILKPLLTNTVSEIISSLQHSEETHHNVLDGTLVNGKANEILIQKEAAFADAERNMRRELIALRAERDGLIDMIDALTSDNDAVTISSKNPSKTLPVHVVRFLEVMPWDDRAHQYASFFEQVHEWQVYDGKNKNWTDRLKAFPLYFKSLPISRLEKSPDPSQTDFDQQSTNQNKLPGIRELQRAFGSSKIQGCLLTNGSCTHVLDLRNGFPLPSEGEWEWMGGWKTESSPTADDDGWSYAAQPKFLISSPQCFGCPGFTEEGTPLRHFRRRIWKRQRLLVSYPGISPRTKKFLSIIGKNMKLTMSAIKLNDQINAMQNRLMEKEEEMDRNAIGLLAQLDSAELEVKEKEDEIRDLKVGSKENVASRARTVSLDNKKKPFHVMGEIVSQMDLLQLGANGQEEGNDLKIESMENKTSRARGLSLDSKNPFQILGGIVRGDKFDTSGKNSDSISDDETEPASSGSIEEDIDSNPAPQSSSSNDNSWKRIGREAIFESVRTNVLNISEKARNLQQRRAR